MDIEYLLLLQRFREGWGSCLTEFLNKMTWFGEMSVAIVITAFIYWCVNKETGTYLLMGWSGNRIVNGVLKVTGCVYRPWIRDARVVPEAKALETATGYSFPSGHSMNAASLFGGMAIRKDVKKGFKVLLWIISLIINPLLKTAIAGFAGTVITCFIQMFYIVFLFPLLITILEKKKAEAPNA